MTFHNDVSSKVTCLGGLKCWLHVSKHWPPGNMPCVLVPTRKGPRRNVNTQNHSERAACRFWIFLKCMLVPASNGLFLYERSNTERSHMIFKTYPQKEKLIFRWLLTYFQQKMHNKGLEGSTFT